MKCMTCNYLGDSQDFISDYVWDDEQDDEVPVYKCPVCGEVDEDKILGVDE